MELVELLTWWLAASVNSEKMTYARQMLRDAAAPRADIPCATCEIYLGMQRWGMAGAAGGQRRN